MDSTEHPAGAFRARGTPAIMRPHEIMGIEANRSWGVCSLNDFRKVSAAWCIHRATQVDRAL
jgi:linoleate 10R-lipoxygenase